MAANDRPNAGASPPEARKEPGSFEVGLARLEAIVKELEQGELPLEQALRLFEEGTSLNHELRSKLDEAERRIEVLTRSRDGAYRPQPFEPGAGE